MLALADGDDGDGVSFEDFASNLLLIGDSHPEGTFEQWLAHSAVVLEADTVEVVAEGQADEAWWVAPTAGAMAGMCSRTLTAPFDRLRTVLQAWDSQPGGGPSSGGVASGLRSAKADMPSWASQVVGPVQRLPPAPAQEIAIAVRAAAQALSAPQRPEGVYSHSSPGALPQAASHGSSSTEAVRSKHADSRAAGGRLASSGVPSSGGHSGHASHVPTSARGKAQQVAAAMPREVLGDVATQPEGRPGQALRQHDAAPRHGNETGSGGRAPQKEAHSTGKEGAQLGSSAKARLSQPSAGA